MNLTQATHLSETSGNYDSITKLIPPIRTRFMRRLLNRAIEKSDSLLRISEIDEINPSHEIHACKRLAFTQVARFLEESTSPQTFVDCDLRASTFQGLNLEEVAFIGCNLQCARFNNAKLVQPLLDDSDARWSVWKHTTLDSGNLRGSQFSGADMRYADFSHCDLTGARFHSVDARHAKFDHANLTDCDFSGSDMRHASFSYAELNRTDFTFCTLESNEFFPVDFASGNYYGVTVNGEPPVGWPNKPLPVWAAPKEGVSPLRSRLRRIAIVRKFWLLQYASILLGPFIHGPFAPARLAGPG